MAGAPAVTPRKRKISAGKVAGVLSDMCESLTAQQDQSDIQFILDELRKDRTNIMKVEAFLASNLCEDERDKLARGIATYWDIPTKHQKTVLAAILECEKSEVVNMPQEKHTLPMLLLWSCNFTKKFELPERSMKVDRVIAELITLYREAGSKLANLDLVVGPNWEFEVGEFCFVKNDVGQVSGVHSRSRQETKALPFGITIERASISDWKLESNYHFDEACMVNTSNGMRQSIKSHFQDPTVSVISRGPFAASIAPPPAELAPMANAGTGVEQTPPRSSASGSAVAGSPPPPPPAGDGADLPPPPPM